MRFLRSPRTVDGEARSTVAMNRTVEVPFLKNPTSIGGSGTVGFPYSAYSQASSIGLFYTAIYVNTWREWQVYLPRNKPNHFWSMFFWTPKNQSSKRLRLYIESELQFDIDMTAAGTPLVWSSEFIPLFSDRTLLTPFDTVGGPKVIAARWEAVELAGQTGGYSFMGIFQFRELHTDAVPLLAPLPTS